ncbi:MAG: HupE/UreJ family protein [Deltaproteobacteria bacterium]|nr:HupE/UreJ family protein [Deltaproteobacteria bacterium]
MKNLRRNRVFYVTFLLAFIFPLFFLHAHALKLSSSEISVEQNQVHWKMKVHLNDFNQKYLGVEIEDLKQQLKSRVGIQQLQQECPLVHLSSNQDLPQEVVSLDFTFDCPRKIQEIDLSYGLFYGDLNHQHLLKWQAADGVRSFTFSQSQSEYHLKFQSSITDSILSFLKMGFEHILMGYDHLLFVFALILGARRGKELIVWVSSFTLAHSLTLALASLKIIHLPSRFVETTIAVSILVVALKEFFLSEERASRGNSWLVFLFGLIHGLGFSSVLSEAGLTRENLWIPLLSFNVGVELGQCGMVLLVFPVLVFLKKKVIAYQKIIKNPLLILIQGVSLFWIFQRVFGD